MAIFKCKMCGGTLSFHEGDRIGECEYCGTKQTIPDLRNDEKILSLYSRADAYRRAYEFDLAANTYNQIISESPNDCEAYWGLALCKFGVVYEKDSAQNKYIPTCNRIHFSSFLKDESYLRALALADDAQKYMFKKDAEYIDSVQSKILDIAKHEKPFDIFICYKELDENKKRTRDSIKAQELYQKLTQAGYKVFFSRITLEEKAGIEYEPYIFAALVSSKVMIHVTYSADNSDSVWVKNEWSRFLSLAKEDNSKQFIPIYFNMDKEDLPKEFSVINSYNGQEEGFEAELLRGIKKLIPTPVLKAEKRKKFKKVLLGSAATLLLGLVIAAVILIPKYQEYRKNITAYKKAQSIFYTHDYLAAKKEFARLGTFKDAREYCSKCDVSRRKQLCTPVAFDNQYNDCYYVNTDGTISHYSPKSENTTIDLNSQSYLSKHGKAVSILLFDPEFHGISAITTELVLYEDGFISNLEKYYQMDDPKQWHDIIKIQYAIANYYLLALRSDGKMLYAKLKKADVEVFYDIHAEWEDDINKWSGIKDFYVLESRAISYDGTSSIILGLNNDNKILSSVRDYHGDEYDLMDRNIDDNYASYFGSISDIQQFLAVGDNSYAAITSDEELLVLRDGEDVQTNIKNAVQIGLSKLYFNSNGIGVAENSDFEKVVYLNEDYQIIQYTTENVVLYDIAYISNGAFVTKNGEIYFDAATDGGMNFQKIQSNCIVFDEWLERMD